MKHKLIVFIVFACLPAWAHAQSVSDFSFGDQVFTVLFALVATLYAVHTRQYARDIERLTTALEALKLSHENRFRALENEIHNIKYWIMNEFVRKSEVNKGNGYD